MDHPLPRRSSFMSLQSFVSFLSLLVLAAGCATTGSGVPTPDELASACSKEGGPAVPPGGLSCLLCGAKINPDERLHVAFTFESGSKCFVEDAAEAAKVTIAHKGSGKPAPKAVVFDRLSGTEIAAEKAFAVLGSAFKPERKPAGGGDVPFFAARAEADEFAKRHGGRVVGFVEAMAALAPAESAAPTRRAGSDKGGGRSGAGGGGSGGGGRSSDRSSGGSAGGHHH